MAHLHNFESDDSRFGLGRIAEETPYAIGISDNAFDYPTGGGHPAPDAAPDFSPHEVPATAIQTLADVSPTMLPALNFATGVADCVDCTTATPAAIKTAAATAAAVVTPLPEAPKTVNYLLIAVGLGLGWALLKSGPKSGLGCAPEPEPVPAVQQDLGRPPRKPKASLKQVDTLEL